jgi:5-methylcytosine-specific restriction endonuclease McrA
MYHFGSRRPKKSNPILKNLDNLTQADLIKIRKKFSEYEGNLSTYHATKADVEIKNKKISEENGKIQARRDAFEAANITLRLEILRRIRQSLFECRAGIIKGVFGGYVEINDSLALPGDQSYVSGGKFDAKIAPSLIQKFRSEKALLDSDMSKMSQFIEIKYLPHPSEPRDYCLLTIAGHKVEIHYDEIDIDELESKLSEHRQKIESQKKKEQELKARAATSEQEKRQQAQAIRRRFEKQISILPNCPYCFEVLTMAGAHLDHIYPVSKGGTSREANLVLVCAQCNLTKKDMVLRQFIKQKNYSADEIYERLELLGKDV